MVTGNFSGHRMWHTLRQQTGWDLRFSGFINLNHQQDGIAGKKNWLAWWI